VEFDPETNSYTSHGPTARARESYDGVKKLKKEVAELRSLVEDLTARVEDLESEQGI